jgi:hypothetical protein
MMVSGCATEPLDTHQPLGPCAAHIASPTPEDAGYAVELIRNEPRYASGNFTARIQVLLIYSVVAQGFEARKQDEIRLLASPTDTRVPLHISPEVHVVEVQVKDCQAFAP